VEPPTDAFLADCASRNMSEETRRKYRDVLWKLDHHLGPSDLQTVEKWQLDSFLARWANASPSTRALTVTVLHQFFAFLVEEEIIGPRLKRCAGRSATGPKVSTSSPSPARTCNGSSPPAQPGKSFCASLWSAPSECTAAPPPGYAAVTSIWKAGSSA
jgi:hypothetical protein